MFGRECLDEKAKVRLLKALEAFMMRRHICEKRSNELETIFAGLTGIAEEGYEKAVLNILRDHTPDDEEFESSFASFPFVPAVIARARLCAGNVRVPGHRAQERVLPCRPGRA